MILTRTTPKHYKTEFWLLRHAMLDLVNRVNLLDRTGGFATESWQCNLDWFTERQDFFHNVCSKLLSSRITPIFIARIRTCTCGTGFQIDLQVKYQCTGYILRSAASNVTDEKWERHKSRFFFLKYANDLQSASKRSSAILLGGEIIRTMKKKKPRKMETVFGKV